MKSRRIAAATALAATVVLATAVSCATRREIRGEEVSGLDRKLSTFVFIEDGDLVDFVVSTQATRYRENEPYIPIEIAVANHGLKQLSLTRESFTLIDAAGVRRPAAGPAELMESYEFLDMDPALFELESILTTKYAAMTRYPSNFSPRRTASRRRSNVVRDLVSIPKFGYVIDTLYFPAPQGGVKGRRFELFMDAPELPDPVFVRFEVR
jgi:hypothetical protein